MGRLVIVVDDSITVCKVIEVYLRRNGYEVLYFLDGIQAINWLVVPNQRVPDLFFVDLCLPRMDGYEVIQRLRAKVAFSKTPFVVISRRNGLVDKLKARLVGAVEYLTKPVATEKYLAVVTKYLAPVLVEA